MAEPRTRIFSDLHFRDPRSLLHDLADFEPLLGDAERVVFNGDSLDTQVASMAQYAEDLRAFAARLEREGREAIWLTGNHDPDWSDAAEISLLEGRVWVTHGDLFFHAIAPWSHHAPELRRRVEAAELGLAPGERGRVETRLRVHREVVRGLPEIERHFQPGLATRIWRLAHNVFPPHRVWEMLKAWVSTPRRVAAVAREQRPRARLAILGHTHFPGVWRVPAAGGAEALTVVNTGSFTRPLGGRFVELTGEHVQVWRIRRGARGLEPSGRVAEFRLGRD